MEDTDPAAHGLPGHNWSVKKLKQWACQALGLLAGRNTLRRVLRQADLTWKKVKKLLGKANPEKRAAHIGRQDETVLRWARLYNRHGPEALAYRHSGGRAPLLTGNRPDSSSTPSRRPGPPRTACPATAGR